MGFIFSELICVASGLGAYPETSEPQSGYGPTKNFESLEKEYVIFCTNKQWQLMPFDDSTFYINKEKGKLFYFKHI